MLKLSEKALEAVRRFKAADPTKADAMFRIRVTPGGCSGMTYQLDLDTNPVSAGDKVFEQGGLKIVVDVKSSLYLQGMEIDYKESLATSGFVFKNPNAKETCNCGESFSS